MKRQFMTAAMFAAALMFGFTTATFTSCSKDDDKEEPEKVEPVNQEPEKTEQVTVKFDTDGGSEVKSLTVNKDGMMTLPAAPSKDGFTFKGWAESKDGEVITSYKATKDATLYAVWEKKEAEQPVSTEPVDLTKDGFSTWSDYVNGTVTGTADCALVIGESTDMPYGDGSVINYIDITEYKTLEVTVSEGEPRFLLNRDVADGQNPDHLINIPNDEGQTAAYETKTDNGDGTTTYVIDLAKIVTEKGYAHLHAIKGANWQNVTVVSMKLTK